MTLFVGLMSGTSMDGIDAAAVSFDDDRPTVLATRCEPIPADLRQRLRELAVVDAPKMDELFSADAELGALFGDAVLHLLDDAKIAPADVSAIGSHGQTIRHRPTATASHSRYTAQIGDPNIIAERTGITTVADFRRRDMAANGQGAPLAPAFHAAALMPDSGQRAVVNIGGIANVTLIGKAANAVVGYDTGPGNTLLDAWSRLQRQVPYDEHGEWARTGTVEQPLLDSLLDDPYFNMPAPKSTGPEHFNVDWLYSRFPNLDDLRAEDVQRTLTELTATSIASSILAASGSPDDVLICGGGVHNVLTMERLRELLAPRPVESTDVAGVSPDSLEAVAFAWLAYRTVGRRAGNLPTVTGASHPVVLGAIYPGSLAN